ncbi:MAG: hypothetical protein WEB58_05330 [Planctomycetaceae bacterium]
MDFFSEKELVTQTGHDISEWPLVIVKELVDNGLDACEEADIAPVITITADAGGITVADNGPGLPEATLKGALDFTIRASNREAYVSPCRGAQGNALKTLLPMPRVIDPDNGTLIVAASGRRHVITCGADPISQRAIIHDDVLECATTGTTIRLEWSAGERWPFDRAKNQWQRPDYRALLESLVAGFALFNPHLSITLDYFGKVTKWKATDPAWVKWKPDKPTSAHWYERAHLERLIGAYVTHDRDVGHDRLVSDLLAEFDGLSGSQKRTKVLDAAGLKRVKLSELVLGDRLDSERIGLLHQAMQKETRPVKPKYLGIIGEDHFRERFVEMGIEEKSFHYSRKIAKDGLPWVLESAFGWKGDESRDERSIFSGANWSAAIKNPFRSFGSTGEGLETALADMRATSEEPIIFALHLAHPRVEYTDRGKSALVIGGAK